tara:strand:- start:46 stop:558 length:513 start_codon:yes stop_codon:yes gene_type:complete
MKRLMILLLAIVTLISCQNNDYRAEFEKNTETAKAYFKLHESENSAAMFEYLHPDIEWHMPVYGAPLAGLNEVKAAVQGYQDAFEDMSFIADYWLPGVNTETGVPDGSTRVYGTWNATHSETGKKVALTAYHSFEFKDGKIFRGGDWFDLGGMMNFIMETPDEEVNSEME